MSYPVVEQPFNYRTKLFPHQLTAIHMMEERENSKEVILNQNLSSDLTIRTNMGIYSDITGYGKTCSVVGLIIRDKMKWDIDEPYIVNEQCCYIGDGMILGTKTHSYKKINTTLIIANNSIFNQWLNEIQNSKLKLLTIQKIKDITNNIDNIKNFDIVLVTPTMYNKLIRYKFNKFIWKRFIYDEPSHTHIPAMSKYNAGFSWFMTATPNMLLSRRYWGQGYLAEVFNSYYFTYDLLNLLIIKNNDDYVKSSYKLPETNEIFHICYQPLFHMVKNYIDSDTSRMIEAGDISSAISRLGGNETSNIVDVIKTWKQETIEKIKLRIEYYTRRNATRHISSLELQKSKLELEIKELDEKLDKRLQDNCSICIDKVDKPVLLYCCQNIFCGKCVLEWMKNHTTCPLCRSKINLNKIIYINNKSKHSMDDKTENDQEQKYTKPETIIKIIENNINGKFIIFSEYTESFQSIINVLKHKKIKFAELKGHASTRKKNIRNFKEGELNVLFLNSNYNGAGINLQEATDIILYHEMSDDTKEQVIGRANRIGRKEKLLVHYLI